MITLKNICLNNAKNKTYLKFEKQLTFHDNSIYFIIGLSGVGKTSIVDFITSPFTDDPIKNGEIILSEDIALKVPVLNKKINSLKITNSSNLWSGLYVNFVRKSIAYIPQKTDSFHPSIPVAKQMYRYYKMVLPNKQKPSILHFNSLLEELSPYAGWDKISLGSEEEWSLSMQDKKGYIEEETNEYYKIIDKNNVKIYEDEFSTGQLQRLFILMGLIQFRVSDENGGAFLIGDEFLVNFTYPEASEVLKNIINFFRHEKKKHKTAIFILHDLSFDFLKLQHSDIKLIGIENTNINNIKKGKYETEDCQKIIAHETVISDFFAGNKWKNDIEKQFFEKFKNSYEKQPLRKDECNLNIQITDNAELYDTITIKEEDCPYKEKLFKGEIKLPLYKNRVIVLTGFSGCGKSTLCRIYAKKINNKSTFRYFPDKMMSSLSEDSQVRIRDDLLIMYNYYNHINSIDDCKEDIENIINKVHFYGDNKEITDYKLDEFLNKKIYDLSGGQQQRYWLARLLFNWSKNKDNKNPELLILDESIASLDCVTKNKIISVLLQEIFFGRGAAMFLISHDLRDISVIYQTLSQSAGPENIDNVFEHYEMFDGNLYKVKNNFMEYCENFNNERCNTYYSLRDNKEIRLRIRTNKIKINKGD
jgi:ABC-type glutathione transport system ATPase component